MGRDLMAAPLEHPRAHDAVETGAFGAEVKLVDRRTNTIHDLNSSASAVWLLMDGDLPVDEIVAELVVLSGAPTVQVQSWVRDSLVHFDSLGLLEGGSEPEGPPAFTVKIVAEQVSGRDVMPRPPDP